MINSIFHLFESKGLKGVSTHLKVVGIVNQYLSAGCSFSDIIRALSSKVTKEQIPYLLRFFLIEKLQYQVLSFNLVNKIDDFTFLLNTLKTRNQFNSNIVYHDSYLGFVCLNPQSSVGWGNLILEKDSLISVYATASSRLQPELNQYLKDIKMMLNGIVDINNKDIYTGQDSVIKNIKTAKTEIQAKTTKSVEVQNKDESQTQNVVGSVVKEEQTHSNNLKKKITPKYSVQVTNELFHNGNVEAWKNIIEAYNTTYPDIELVIYYQGRKVVNINTLFKWGKVKNGDVILFCLVGNKFQSIAKLQRYFFEGASNRFNRYLKKDLNKPLNLF